MADLRRAPLARNELAGDPPGEDVRRQLIDDAGVGLYETRLDGAFRYVNGSLVTMLGYASIAEFIADRPVAGSFYADPADQARSRAAVQRDGRVRGLVFEARRRDGTRIWLSETASPLRDSLGAITGYIGSISEVSELVAARDRIAAAEEGYRRIFDRATEGIYRSSLNGRMLRANPALARLNGYASEEELLRSIKDIAKEWYVDPGRRAAFKELLETHGSLENFESEVWRHRSRERIWISENAYLVRGEDGRPLYYEGTVRDITERKSAETAARRALEAAEAGSHAKSQFLAHMSHELRTPLNAILGFSDLLRGMDERRFDAAKVRDYAGDIHKSGRHLLDLINDVLDLSRIENDAMPLSLVPILPQDAIEAALATVRPLAEAKAIALVCDPSPVAAALADRRALHQCLLNVLSNAVKFSARGGTIRLAVAAADGRIAFSVSDTGCGIAPDRLARIGEPFNTGATADCSSAGGTGLGLAITRSLIDSMGGSFAIDSTLGAGTCVTLQVPAAGTLPGQSG